MKYFKIIPLFIALMAIFSACQKDLLDKKPLDKITEASFFLTTNDLQTYVNQFYTDQIFRLRRTPTYTAFFPWFGDDNNSDNSIDVSVLNPLLAGQRTISYQNNAGYSTYGSWGVFTTIRQVNYFFDNYKKCKEPFNNYKQYVGEAHFFRAIMYYYLLQCYGDIPWITKALAPTSPELLNQRDKRNIVADNIIAQLDSAAMYLPATKDNGASRINKWLALLLQSEVALYEGTWEKYHAGDPFAVSNPQTAKYLNKAVEAASAVMNSGLYSIYTKGNPEIDFANCFRMRDYSANGEIIFWKQFNNTVGVNNSYGGFNYLHERPYNKSLTKSLADAFLCKDGKPISVSPLFAGYNTLSVEAKDRDPRFHQTIGTPGDAWKIDANGTIHDYNELYAILNNGSEYNAGTGYVIAKQYDPQMIYHKTNYEDTPWIYARYAEVLLTYAEAKAELGTLTQEDIDKSIKKLRDRVGMPNLVISNITNDPKWDFPTLSPVINEIRRERRVELATEGFRWQDIARWAGADELIVGKKPIGFKASQITSTFFPVDANGFLDPFKSALTNGYEFKIGRDYLDPIPQSEIVLNPKLTQNPGW
ncbi:MAG: RagB/SusD family nutrient uptake outer membrane protein [Prolixibacteraceae bacterium]|nr:RagB/SusD family nutrient uptake outer membrane protein [Prolixibacteraceae bacterium]